MLESQILQYGHAIAQSIAVHKGLGRHLFSLSHPTITHVVECIQVIKGFSLVPSCLGRVSIALYQRRLLPPQSSMWKIGTLMIVLVLDPVVNLITVIQVYAQCGPNVSALWDQSVAATAHCENPLVETGIGYGQSGRWRA